MALGGPASRREGIMLDEHGEFVHGLKDLPNGRRAYVIPLTFGRARVVVGQAGSLVYDDGWGSEAQRSVYPLTKTTHDP